MRACVRACVRVCACERACACVRACVCVCVRVCDGGRWLRAVFIDSESAVCFVCRMLCL